MKCFRNFSLKRRNPKRRERRKDRLMCSSLSTWMRSSVRCRKNRRSAFETSPKIYLTKKTYCSISRTETALGTHWQIWTTSRSTGNPKWGLRRVDCICMPWWRSSITGSWPSKPTSCARQREICLGTLSICSAQCRQTKEWGGKIISTREFKKKIN